METIGSSSDSRQLRPFSKLELLLKERICSQRDYTNAATSMISAYGVCLLITMTAGPATCTHRASML